MLLPMSLSLMTSMGVFSTAPNGISAKIKRHVIYMDLWARAHMGPGPIWARAHMGPGPGPGPRALTFWENGFSNNAP